MARLLPPLVHFATSVYANRTACTASPKVLDRQPGWSGLYSCPAVNSQMIRTFRQQGGKKNPFNNVEAATASTLFLEK